MLAVLFFIEVAIMLERLKNIIFLSIMGFVLVFALFVALDSKKEITFSTDSATYIHLAFKLLIIIGLTGLIDL